MTDQHDTERVQISRWCHTFTRNGVMALFNSLTLEVSFLPEQEGKTLLTFLRSPQPRQETLKQYLAEEEFQSLLEQSILTTDPEQDAERIVKIREKLRDEISLELMYLLVTDWCNLRCTYCFEETPAVIKGFRPTHMTPEIAAKAVALFAKLTKQYGKPEREKVIHLYGGEPLINIKVVKSAVLEVERLKQEGILPRNCNVAIVTNGIFVTDAVAEFLAAHSVTVGLSIDGPRNVTNTYRVGKGKNLDVFEAVMRAYERLKKHGAKVGLSVTITPLAVEHFDELLEFFTREFDSLDGLSLNLLHFTPGVPVGEAYYTQAAQCQLKAFERFRDLGIYEERVMRKVRAFVDQRVMYADCGVIGNQLVIAPDGQIGVCQDFVKPRTYFKGSVLDVDADPVASGLFKDWSSRSPLFMEQCFECPALGICGGGCPASAELKTGSRWNIDERVCSHSKFALEWLIWQTYDQMAKSLAGGT